MIKETEEMTNTTEEMLPEEEKSRDLFSQRKSDNFQTRRQNKVFYVEQEYLEKQNASIIWAQLAPYVVLIVLVAVMSFFLLKQSQHELNILQTLLFS